MKKNKTAFISDLHLYENEAKISQIFKAVLHKQSHQLDALYILGDFFEAWIGDDDLTPFHQSIIDSLRRATVQGLPIFILHGNRDFLLGKKFMQATGATYLPDETVIDVYGKQVLLLHGDTLCTLDQKYLRLRKKLRNKLIQRVFLWMPLRWRRRMADKMRAGSKAYTQKMSREMMDVTPLEVEHVLQKHGVDLMIHGHTHRPAIHDNRIVLGAWHESGNMLLWKENGEKELISF